MNKEPANLFLQMFSRFLIILDNKLFAWNNGILHFAIPGKLFFDISNCMYNYSDCMYIIKSFNLNSVKGAGVDMEFIFKIVSTRRKQGYLCKLCQIRKINDE